MSPPRVSVVAVTYYPGESLRRFLSSLEGATAEHPIPLVLVDNAPDDPVVAAMAEDTDVTVLHTGSNLGYGRAANLGVQRTETEFVVVANPDVTWTPGSLDVLLAAAERWQRGATFGPLIHASDGSIYPSARELPSLGTGIGHALLGWVWPRNPWTIAYRRDDVVPTERTTGWLSGSCLLVRRSAFDEVGGFDPAYFMYFEDLDLGSRLSQAGWQNVYVASAVITHDRAHATSRYAAAMVHEHHRSARTYLARIRPGWRWWPVRAVIGAGLSLRAVAAQAAPRVVAGAPAQQRLPEEVRHRQMLRAVRLSARRRRERRAAQ